MFIHSHYFPTFHGVQSLSLPTNQLQVLAPGSACRHLLHTWERPGKAEPGSGCTPYSMQSISVFVTPKSKLSSTTAWGVHKCQICIFVSAQRYIYLGLNLVLSFKLFFLIFKKSLICVEQNGCLKLWGFFFLHEVMHIFWKNEYATFSKQWHQVSISVQKQTFN